MFWKLFIIKIIIFCILTIEVSYASNYSNNKRNDTYECKLGSKTPYRCVANYDDSSLQYTGIL